MLLGMAERRPRSCAARSAALLLYTPVVHPREFDVAIAYLIRRLEEGASQRELHVGGVRARLEPGAASRRETRPLPRLAARESTGSFPARTACRTARPPRAPHAGSGFGNAPDTDPAVAANRDWGRGILSRVADSTLGVATAEASRADGCRGRRRGARSRRARPPRRGARSAPTSVRRSCTAPATCSRRGEPSCSRSWRPRRARRSTRPTPRYPRPSTSPTTTPSAGATSTTSTVRPSPRPGSRWSRRRGTSPSRSRPARRSPRSPPVRPSSSSPRARPAAAAP